MSAEDTIFKDQTVVFTGKLASMSRKQAQQLVREHAGNAPDSLTITTEYLVVGDAGYLCDIAKSKKINKAEELIAKGSKTQIISEGAFLEMLNLESRYQLGNKFYSLTDILAIYTKLRKDQVRYFQKWGLLKPEVKTNNAQYFQFKDLLIFRRINEYLKQGKKLRSIAQGLSRELFPSDQLVIEFQEEKPEGKVLQLKPATEPERSADEWYDLGSSCDTDDSTYTQAIEAYENALALEPDYFPAAVNLGNLFFAKGENEKAKALYLKAYELAADNHKVLFNLGNLYDELGEYDKALEFFRKAIKEFPLYADAHFNIAVVYEKIGLIYKAKEHWQTYLKIDDAGEWAEIAKEHLSER